MESKIFEGLPIIATENLIIRNFRIKDAENYFYYHNISDAVEFYDWKPDTPIAARENIKEIIDDYKELQSIRWAITQKSSDSIIGDCGILTDGSKAEISYILSKDYWGKGVMSEALKAVISVCFKETEIYRVQALTLHENIPSGRILQKLGFTEEGVLRKYGYNPLTDKRIDLIMWSLLKEEHELTDYEIIATKKY